MPIIPTEEPWISFPVIHSGFHVVHSPSLTACAASGILLAVDSSRPTARSAVVSVKTSGVYPTAVPFDLHACTSICNQSFCVHTTLHLMVQVSYMVESGRHSRDNFQPWPALFNEFLVNLVRQQTVEAVDPLLSPFLQLSPVNRFVAIVLQQLDSPLLDSSEEFFLLWPRKSSCDGNSPDSR
eukprot:gb/GECG01006544.1/.p1 GENE.gb/GECG01006544.1/~~gb/GECG01006544.1/.p1  ORF type:complete len:182 (+),score=9.36 gb/GECG01006544.1/:1-546(+)